MVDAAPSDLRSLTSCATPRSVWSHRAFRSVLLKGQEWPPAPGSNYDASGADFSAYRDCAQMENLQPIDVACFSELIVRLDRYVPNGIARAPGVTTADRYREYLTKAEEAEKQAEMAADDHAKDSWLKVASGYRDLASMAEAQRRDRRWKA